LSTSVDPAIFLGVAAADDPFGKALRDLDRILDVNVEHLAMIKRRIAEIQGQHSDGLSYTEIVEAAPPPLLVQLVTESKQMLDGFGARVRRAEALVLHQEGMTMEEIAERFGVTRQRVSALLREARRDRPDT
jgi:DNA-directed RNA polymerase specialized sigma24 family protein